MFQIVLASEDVINASQVSLAIKMAKEIVNPALTQYNSSLFATSTAATMGIDMTDVLTHGPPGPASNEHLHHVHDTFAWRLMNLTNRDQRLRLPPENIFLERANVSYTRGLNPKYYMTRIPTPPVDDLLYFGIIKVDAETPLTGKKSRNRTTLLHDMNVDAMYGYKDCDACKISSRLRNLSALNRSRWHKTAAAASFQKDTLLLAALKAQGKIHLWRQTKFNNVVVLNEHTRLPETFCKDSRSALLLKVIEAFHS